MFAPAPKIAQTLYNYCPVFTVASLVFWKTVSVREQRNTVFKFPADFFITSGLIILSTQHTVDRAALIDIQFSGNCRR